MKRNGLGKLYDRLTPEERFRLDVEAMARSDEAESRKLVDTCPRKNYSASDWGFSGRWQVTIELTLFVSLDLSQHLSRLKMLDALREALPTLRTVFENEAAMTYMRGYEAGSRHAWKAASMEGDPPGWEPLENDDYDEGKSDPQIEENLDTLSGRIEEVDLAPRLLEKLEQSIAEDALAIWEGYRRFCVEELDLEAGKLLAVVFEPAVNGLIRLMALKEKLGLEPDEEKAGEYRDVLSECWERQRRKFERLSG